MLSKDLTAFARLQSDPTLLVDRAGVVLFANHAIRDLLQRTDAQLQSLFDFADDPEKVNTALRRCARSGEPVVGRLQLLTANREPIAFPYRAILLRRPVDGSPAVIALQHETSARYRALTDYVERANKEIRRRQRQEQLARASESRLEAIWNSIGDGAIATDADGCVVRMNPIAEQLTGWAVAEALGRPMHELFNITHAYTGDEVENPVDKVLQTGKSVVLANHTVLCARDGTKRHIADSGAPILAEDGQISGVVLVFRDVSDAYAARARLRHLTTAIEQTVDSIVITDASGIIEYVNPAFERLTGFSQDQMRGKTTQFLTSEEHDPAFFADLWATISGGQVWSGRLKNRRANGTVYLEDANISPVRSVDQKIVGFVSVQRDVTEQLRLEQELRQAQRLEAIGRLAGGVAHDFNNLLTVILTLCDLMTESVPDDDPIKQDLREVTTAAERAETLTHQLLAYSRRQMLQPRVLNLNKIVRDLSKMLRRLIHESITLREDLTPDLAAVCVDPGQMEQVIMNLVVNARDAMPHGGQLTIKTVNEHIKQVDAVRLPGLPVGHYVRLTVRDSGTGMSDDVAEQVFEPFFTTKGPGLGTGLGLSTVHGIVKQSGGYIFVDTTPGQGSSFCLFLPPAGGQPQDTSRRPEARARRGHETILVVEDDDAVLRLTVRVLQMEGYNVLQATSGSDAISMIGKANQLDLLLTDVVMPGASGPQVAERFLAENPLLRILFMSGYNEEQITLRHPQADDLPLLAKPFTPKKLTKRVRAILDRPAAQPPPEVV